MSTAAASSTATASACKISVFARVFRRARSGLKRVAEPARPANKDDWTRKMMIAAAFGSLKFEVLDKNALPTSSDSDSDDESDSDAHSTYTAAYGTELLSPRTLRLLDALSPDVNFASKTPGLATGVGQECDAQPPASANVIQEEHACVSKADMNGRRPSLAIFTTLGPLKQQAGDKRASHTTSAYNSEESDSDSYSPYDAAYGTELLSPRTMRLLEEPQPDIDSGARKSEATAIADEVQAEHTIADVVLTVGRRASARIEWYRLVAGRSNFCKCRHRGLCQATRDCTQQRHGLVAGRSEVYHGRRRASC